MGNKPQNDFFKKKSDSEEFQPGFGFTKIKSQKPNKPIRQRITLPYTPSQDSHWQALHINSPENKFMIYPIKYKKKNSLLEKKIKLTFLYNNLTLKKFLELNSNQIYPEIMLLNFISNISSGLKFAQNYKKTHLNISLESIYLTDEGNWLISPPNPDFLNLMTRIEFRDNKELKFLLTTFYDKETESGKFDVFCLGILLLHFVFPFSKDERMGFLKKESIDLRLKFLKEYYSREFVFIVENCVVLEFEKRFGVEDVVRSIREVFSGGF